MSLQICVKSNNCLENVYGCMNNIYKKSNPFLELLC